MSVFRRIAALAASATLAACTTTDVSQGVGFGPPGGTATMGANPTSTLSAAGWGGTTAYDDGFMYGRLTRTFQGGTDLATLDQIRYHRFLSMRSAERGVAEFRGRVSEMTGCLVTDVSVRVESQSWSSVTGRLDCR